MKLLRNYQKEVIIKVLEILKVKNNTLCVMSTGAGKTYTFCHLVKQFIDEYSENKNILVLQDRWEIFEQNINTFKEVAPNLGVSEINSNNKEVHNPVTFAMVQTLHKNLKLLTRFDLVIIDECHHSAANTYLKIIEQIKEENPDVKLVGFTATPLRGDKKSLIKAFDNIACNISIDFLIREGVLVPPRIFIKNIGIGDKKNKQDKLTYDELEQLASDSIQKGKADINTAISYFKEIVKDRKTLAFTNTIADATKICNLFNEKGISSAVVTGKMKKKEREKILKNFKDDKLQVIFNVSVLTEGFDAPIASSILLFKGSSYKSTFIQILGRGLRGYPEKIDCIVLDFGLSTARNKNLVQKIEIAVKDKEQLSFMSSIF